MSTIQSPVEHAVIELLARTGPSTMDDVVGALPLHNWNEVFFAVDKMSREGRVVLRRLPKSGYQLSLVAAWTAARERHIKPVPVRFCAGCGYLGDAIQPKDGEAQWLEAHQYLKMYGLTWGELDRREDICPACARVLACGYRRPSATRA